MPQSPVVARPASSVLVLRPNNGVEVLMVQRPDRGFFGGLMVFPGGAVEPCDESIVSHHVDRSFRVAGLRETAEEVGILVTGSGYVSAQDLRGADLLDHAGRVESGLGIDRMTLISRWITPEFAPKRFDTRFYLVSIEGDPEIALDANELVGFSWVTPGEAIRKHSDNEWLMVLPTVSHLRWLARHESIEAAEAAASGADGRTIIEPIDPDNELLVRFRGDSEH
jgi:8-oxo-dGTP pyrophosphatase MutT (NUDIX family)